MKKLILGFCLAGFVLFNFSGVYAQDASPATETIEQSKDTALIDTADMRYNKTPINKLGRGLANIGTFYLEVPASMTRVSKDKGEFLGFTVGFFQGIFTSLFRLTVGLYDTVTFIIPSYSKPLMQPEYATESLERAHIDYDASYPTAK